MASNPRLFRTFAYMSHVAQVVVVVAVKGALGVQTLRQLVDRCKPVWMAAGRLMGDQNVRLLACSQGNIKTRYSKAFWMKGALKGATLCPPNLRHPAQ
jgi:hypothetical protein